MAAKEAPEKCWRKIENCTMGRVGSSWLAGWLDGWLVDGLNMLAHCGIVKLIVPSRRWRCNLGQREHRSSWTIRWEPNLQVTGGALWGFAERDKWTNERFVNCAWIIPPKGFPIVKCHFSLQIKGSLQLSGFQWGQRSKFGLGNAKRMMLQINLNKLASVSKV